MGRWEAVSGLDYDEDRCGVDRVRCATQTCEGWVTFPASEAFCSECLIRQRLRNAQRVHELTSEKRRSA